MLFRQILIIPLIMLTGCENSKPTAIEPQVNENSIGTDNSNESNNLGQSANNELDSDEPLAGCGFSSFNKDFDLFDLDIRSADVRISGVAGDIFPTQYEVVIQGKMELKGNSSEIFLKSRNDIVSARPAQARTETEKKLREVTGNQEAQVMQPSKWKAFYEDAGIDEVTCAVIPVTRIKNSSGAYKTEIEYDPGLPYIVSPRLSQARFEKDIASKVWMSGIRGTVISSTNPSLRRNEEIEGSVEIDPVSSNISLKTTEGSTVQINADYAFRVAISFGAERSNLGINTETTYYVDDGEFIAVLLKTEFNEAPIVQYLKGE